jgi:hypothetical protein
VSCLPDSEQGSVGTCSASPESPVCPAHSPLSTLHKELVLPVSLPTDLPVECSIPTLLVGKSSLGFARELEFRAGRPWLTPAILATQEEEIRRTAVQSQPGQIVRKTLSQKYLTHTHIQKKG